MRLPEGQTRLPWDWALAEEWRYWGEEAMLSNMFKAKRFLTEMEKIHKLF